MKTKLLTIRIFLILTIILVGELSYSQIKNPFDIRYQTTVRGDLTIISNNIVSRDPANTPYNDVGGTSSFNDQVNMHYIDVDGNNSTFNSSSAALNLTDPECSNIVHAGLYWSATYRYEVGNNPASGRNEDWDHVKFRVPGGNYVDITPTSLPYNTQVLYNAFTDTNQTNVGHGPYSCFADVTSLLAPLANPNGNYFVGNIRVSRDGRNNQGNFAIPGGVAGGWTLVIVYENINLPGKKITTFDGHAVIASGAGNMDIPVSGFITLPPPLPVRAKMAVSSLEGDNRITGDQLFIKADGVATFTNLFNTPPPTAPVLNNFFNSSITVNGANFLTRNPNSINTLGWDSHLIRINNPLNSIIPNDETGVTLRATSTQDKYDIFFTSFDVEIIEPKIPLIKTVEDFSGNNLDGQPLGLGQEFFYSLCFENTGNDNAQNFVITDQLPTNIIFPVDGTITVGDDIIMPHGVSYTFNSATNQLTFTVNNNLVEENDPQYCIKIKVRTPVDCFDVIDACANIITNQAFVSYQGEQNTQIITDNPSFNGFDECTYPTPGATNFLTDIDLCSFVREEVLCGNSVVLTAANGYSNYVWTYDHDNNPATPAIPFPNGNTQSITVNNIGTYYVSMITPAPCISLNETINVVYFNDLASISNPVTPFADEVAICPNDGSELPKIILCGSTDSQFIQSGITSAANIVWQQLVVGSCPGVTITDCANTNTSCVWNQVGTGPDYLASNAGQYRMVIFYQNGCFRSYYFNVYKNVLNPTITSTDIVCNTEGSITISNIPLGYEYSLSPTGPWQTNNTFSNITSAGSYTVYIRQTGVANGCVFEFPFIDVIEKILDVDVITTNQLCNNGFGSIRVQVNGVNPQYYYQLFLGSTLINSVGPTNTNNFLFSNLNPGTYTVTATTDDGCTHTEVIVIQNLSNLTLDASVSQHISCTQGNIQVNPSGGQPPYNYAIYSYNGVLVNPANYQFQTSVIFDVEIGGQGDYQFIVVDSNNCTGLSNIVTINLEPPVNTTEVHTNVTCNGLNNGTITVTAAPTNGYNVTYSIDGINFQLSNVFTGLAPGNYTITVKYKKGNRECFYSIDVVITEPQPLIGQSQLVQQRTCLVGGTIQAINVTGGTIPYSYSINGTTFQSSNVFSNLNAGTYTITIRDANNCTYQTLPIEITPAIAPTDLITTSTALTCPTLTSNVTATVVGGTAPFTFQIIAPSIINPNTTVGTTATFNNLAAETYTIRVTDSKGCTYQEFITIQAVELITVNGNTVSNVQCFGTATGSALFTVANFSSTYSYTLNGGTPITNQVNPTISLSNLTAGTYTIVVTDSETNCQATRVVTVTQPTSALQLSAPFTPITCITNGNLNATATGGWGSYQYTLTQPDATTIVQSNGVFGNLSQTGTYTISVQDANNCIVSTTFIINPTTNPDLTLSPTSNLCITNTTGASLIVTTTGGTPGYQYQINGGTLQNSGTFANLIAGTYTIRVVDSYGCEDTITQVITPQLTAQATLTKALDCTSNPDATINVSINGGLSPYQYQINFNNGGWGALNTVTGTTFSYTTAIAGTYQFQITDAQGCVFQTNTITISPISNPSILSIVPVSPLCGGDNNGTLTVNIDTSFGTAPFQYNINGGVYQTSNVFTNLVAGTYTIGVRDSKDCTDTETFILTQPQPLLGQSLLVQPITCIITTGTIQATAVSGGTNPYEYSINGVTFVSNPVFTGLSAGTYTITIKDANDCIIATNPITLTVPLSPTDITLTSSAITCPSLSTNIQATAIGGTAPYTYQIISPSTINPTSITGNTANFNNLPASTTTVFTIRVTDANGCEYQKNIPVQTIPLISVSGIVNNIVACLNDTNGQVTYTVSGFSSNYSYSVNSGTVVTNQTNSQIVLSNLAAGTYSILVTDLVTNCTATTSVTVLSPSAQLALNAPFTQPTCNIGGSVNATATGGWGSYQYELTYPSSTTVTQNSGLFSNLIQNGTYTIKVTDANGCEVSQSFTLTPYVNPSIVVDLVNSDLCYDTTNSASIEVIASGGTPSYQYQIQLNGGSYSLLQSNPAFSNLSPGNYIIQVVDNFGCKATVNQVIVPQLLANATLTKNLDCSTSPNATININITGGTTPYQYQVNVNNTGFGALTNVSANPFNYSVSTAGTYQFSITDAGGCNFVTNVITVNPITNPSITSLVQTTPILCNGNNNATITTTINTSSGIGPFEYSIDGTTFQATPTFSGLIAGTYTVTVRDSNLCTDTETITINEPNPIIYNITKTDIICTGTITQYGEINVENVSGGTQPYTYYLSNNFGLIDQYTTVTNENHTFVILNFGIYTVEVIDANGCSLITNNITIASPPDDLDIDVSTATANCVSGGTAIVTVSTTILSGSYAFAILTQNTPPAYPGPEWIPGDAGTPETATFTGLIPGVTYTFIVLDLVTNCYYFETANAPIITPSTITTTIDVVQNVSCTGSGNGSVSFSMTNFDPSTTSVSYQIFNSQSNTPTTPVFTGTSVVDQPIEVVTNFAILPPGIYYLLITENDGVNAGCTSASTSFQISQSTNLLTVTATATNDNCNPDAGVVTAIGQYGTPGYNFIIRDAALTAPLANDPLWNSASTFNVESGNYIVYIKDANDCIQQTPINVGLDTSPEITSVVVTNPCANEGSFEITVTRDTVTNIGIPPYTYQVDGGVSFVENASTFTIQNLFSGSHSIRITDANGCFFDFPFTINQNLSGNVIVVAQPTCVPVNSGSIQVTAANGTGVYSFTINTTPIPTTISNGTAIAAFTGLNHGNYIVTVNDGNCSIPLSIQLEEPNPVDFTLITQDPSCNGDTNGVIEVFLNPLNDNNPPYTYTLSAPGFTTITQNNGLFNVGLGENNYTVTVESSRGCQLALPITLTDPDVLVANDTNVYSFVCTSNNTVGTITLNGLTVTGGDSNYFYSIDNVNFQTSNSFTITDTGATQTITIYIKDGKGCNTTFVYTINPLPTISTPIIVQNIPLSCTDDEEITISFTGNPSGSYTYQLLPSGTITSFTGNSFTPATINATGQYTYEIIDTSTGCSLLATHNVLPYPVTNVTAQPTQAVDCFGNSNGQLSFTLQNYSGSYDYEVFTSPGNISVLTGTSSLSIFTTTSTLAAGNYYVVINENAYPECTLTSPVITIDSPAQPLAVQLVATNDRNCLTDIGTILATATGGTSPYQYQLSNAGGIVQAFSSDNYFENLSDDTYTVTVTDANNCQISDIITVGLDPSPEIDLALVNPCATEGQFEIEITRTIDGITPYTYVVDGGASFTQNATLFTISNLLSGLHTITIADANGCGQTKTLTILPVLSGTITSVIHPSCANNDGVIDADATNGSGSYTYILQNDLGVTIDGPNTTGLFNTNLGHGNYTVVITDSDPLINCSVTLPVNLEQPTPVNYTLDIIQPSCNVINGGTANGSITVQLDASNDNPPYTYSISDGINPPITQNNGVFTNLAGSATGITYTITVESNRGCQKVDTVTLQTPPELVIPAIAVGQFGCNSNNTANVITITVPTPTGGTAPYLYSFDGINFSNLNTFDIIDNGTTQTVTVTVKDANSCQETQTVGPINPLIKVDATLAQVSALTCVNDEVVQINIIGDPTHNYTYQLLPSGATTAVTSNPFTTTLSQPGTYNYLIVDTSTNCSVVTNDYVINPLPEFEVNANPLTDVTCYNGNDGIMNFTVSGYNGSFNYEVIDETGNLYANGTNNTSNNPIQVTGLIAGNFTISVSIPNTNSYEDCTKISNVITIGTPQELQLTIAQTSPVTCTNDKGTITVTGTIGGSGSYEYQLVLMPSGTIVSPYTYSSTSVFTGLGSGAYKVLVRDTNAIGCEANQLITLNPATLITASYNLSTNNLNCFGDNNASVTVTSVIGGQGSYQYTLTYPNGTIAGPQQSPTFTGLSASAGYVLSVTDGWDCDVSLPPFTITEPTPILATLSLQTGLTCTVTPQVEITATGGTPPYIVNGLSFNSSIILNVTMPSAGNGVFQYTVTDSNGCSPVQTNEIVIEPIAPIVVELQSYTLNVNCANEDNAVVIVTNTTGGQGNYQYYLQNSSGANIAGPNVTGVFNNIAGSIVPGETYYVYVTSGDCNQTSAAILVTEPQLLAVPSIINKNISCFGKKDGEISLTLTGGVLPYQFAVSPNLSQTIDPTNPNNITITGLGAGTYDILYQDANGCYGTVQTTISEPSALVFFQPTVVSPKCDGESGSVTITASGGTPPYQFSFDGDANYISNGTNTYTNNTEVLGGQEYEIYIKDANGCETNATIQTQPSVDLSSTYVLNPDCATTANPNANTLTIFINDSLLPTTQFSLDNQTNYQSSNVFTNLTPGNHTVYIKNDNGCIKQTEVVTVTQIPVLELSASETGLNQITAVASGGTEPYTFVFNGNNTGSNNVYIINYTGQQTITVIDDNGCEETVLLPATFYDIEIPNYFTPDLGWTPENIDNFNDLITKIFDRYGREIVKLRKGEKWYGDYRGNPLPSGDYWYIVEVNDGTGRTFVGNVTLYR